MTLKEYAAKINQLLKDGHGDLELCFAMDNEGNGFSSVFYEPSLGYFDGESFSNAKHGEQTPNAICIN